MSSKLHRRGGVGRPFVKTVAIAPGGVLPDGLQAGQWIRVGNAKRSSRFVGYLADGTALVVPPTGGRVSTAAFRLGRDKAKQVVLSVIR